MLTALDDTLMHQCAELFAHTSVSDHRFFDRNVHGVHAPDGSLNLSTSFGVYKNNNVMDGFAMLQHDGARQFNHRYSRRLDQNYDDVAIGALSVEILEPLVSARLRLAPGDHVGSYDIVWTAVLEPHLEDRHYRRHGGRIVRDHLRTSQFGKASGWINIEDKRTDFKDWFAWRDHSWGVRPGVGGFEPNTGSLEKNNGWLGIFNWWLTEEAGCLFQLQEDGDGNRLYLNGNIAFRDGKPPLTIIDAKHDIRFYESTRRYRTLTLELTAHDGSKWVVEAESIGRPWVYRGGGYDHGYNDGRGLGVWRGDFLEEHDQYDISHPEDAVFPDGKVLRPMHREQFARVTINGKPGQAYTPVISTGPNKRYGFEGTAEVMPG